MEFAQEWASELDSLEQIKGPLHGIPVSIKEHCNVTGMDSTMGFAQFLFRPAQEDAVIVQALKVSFILISQSKFQLCSFK